MSRPAAAAAGNGVAERERDDRFQWLPSLAVAGGIVILLLETRPFRTGWLGLVIFATIALMLLVVLRQMTAVKENLRLLAERAERRSELRFQALVKDSSDITGIYAVDGTIVFVSSSVERWLGLAPHETVGRNSFDFVHPDDRVGLRAAFGRARRETDFCFRQEYRFRHRDGSWRMLEGIGKAFYDAEGNFAGILQNSRDVTERKAAETKLRAFAARLEQSNRELEAFAFVASHDLQEPLRKVQAFGDRLERRHGAALGAEGRDNLRRMRESAGRMQALVKDLLTFSRVATKNTPFAPTDLNEILRAVLADLEIRIEETGALVETARLPVIEADAVQMRQLLQNLVSNALKFHRPGEAPRVRVYAAGDEPEGVFRLVVEDDGIGFDEKYLDRIFTVFQRLHAGAEYEGSGIGLAVCRKIAERHGGRITASGRPGRGSSFSAVLPIKQKTEDSLHEIIS